MGWIPVLISGIAAATFLKSGHVFLGVAAIIVSTGCFWSWGIMHNYATNAARNRKGYRGGFNDISQDELKAVPDWIAFVNMAFSFVGIVLLIVSIIL